MKYEKLIVAFCFLAYIFVAFIKINTWSPTIKLSDSKGIYLAPYSHTLDLMAATDVTYKGRIVKTDYGKRELIKNALGNLVQQERLILPINGRKELVGGWAAIDLDSSKIFIAGGYFRSLNLDKVLSNCWLFNKKTGVMLETGSLRTPRSCSCLVKLSDGNILISGGYDSKNNILHSLELYERQSQSCIYLAAMKESRVFHTGIEVEPGMVAFIGGQNKNSPLNDFPTDDYLSNSVEFFNPKTRLSNILVQGQCCISPIVLVDPKEKQLIITGGEHYDEEYRQLRWIRDVTHLNLPQNR